MTKEGKQKEGALLPFHTNNTVTPEDLGAERGLLGPSRPTGLVSAKPMDILRTWGPTGYGKSPPYSEGKKRLLSFQKLLVTVLQTHFTCRTDSLVNHLRPLFQHHHRLQRENRCQKSWVRSLYGAWQGGHHTDRATHPGTSLSVH